MSGEEGAERITIGRVSAGFFPLLGVSPSVGRNFLEEEDRPGGEPVVILGNGLWKRRFGGDPAVLGQSLILDGSSKSVIGILPASFNFPGFQSQPDLWLPLMAEKTDKYNQMRLICLIGRLRPPGRFQAARAELDSINQMLPSSKALNSRVLLSNWQESITQNAQLPLLLFLGAVVFVLLIACCNVANLLLARAATREKEIAIRTAVGSRRNRIFRQLLTESFLITLLGAILGFVLALWMINALRSLVSENLVQISAIHIDLRVLGFALVVSAVTLLAIGIYPALQMSRFSVSESLKEGSRSSMGPGFHRTRKSLIAAEVGPYPVAYLAGCIQPWNRITKNIQDLAFDILQHASLGIDSAGNEMYGIEWCPDDGAEV
jgi:predicted permease